MDVYDYRGEIATFYIFIYIVTNLNPMLNYSFLRPDWIILHTFKTSNQTGISSRILGRGIL